MLYLCIKGGNFDYIIVIETKYAINQIKIIQVNIYEKKKLNNLYA